MAIVGDVIYVIEPHSDDAFLSLGWSIRQWVAQGRRVEIVTVHSDEDVRAAEAAAYARSVGAGWTGLGRRSTPLRELFVPGGLPPLELPLLPDEALDPAVTRIWPLGLEHPEHLRVAALAPPGDLHYVDTPYQLSLERQDAVAATLDGLTIEWWLRPRPEKWEAATLFESQQALFTLYPTAQLEHVPEIVVS